MYANNDTLRQINVLAYECHQPVQLHVTESIRLLALSVPTHKLNRHSDDADYDNNNGASASAYSEPRDSTQSDSSTVRVSGSGIESRRSLVCTTVQQHISIKPFTNSLWHTLSCLPLIFNEEIRQNSNKHTSTGASAALAAAATYEANMPQTAKHTILYVFFSF